jgi:hypothetical protein
MGTLVVEIGRRNRDREFASASGLVGDYIEGQERPGHQLTDAGNVDRTDHSPFLSGRAALLACTEPALQRDLPAGRGHRRGDQVELERYPASIDQDGIAVLGKEGGDEVEAGLAVVDLGANQDLLLGLKLPADHRPAEVKGVEVGPRSFQQLIKRQRPGLKAGGQYLVVQPSLFQSPQLPEAQLDAGETDGDDDQVTYPPPGTPPDQATHRAPVGVHHSARRSSGG